MKSWSEMFGKQPPRGNLSSHVRTRYHCERGSKRGAVTFVFSKEILEITEWRVGDRLDLLRDGERLLIGPSATGRKLRDEPAVQWAIDKNDLDKAKKLFGFDPTQRQFWDIYNVDGQQLVLLLKDMGVAEESS